MANVLRDFFILEFAIYNFGNVSKQFNWIRRGLSEVNFEFAQIGHKLQRIRMLSQEMDYLQRMVSKMQAAKAMGITIDDNKLRFYQNRLDAIRQIIRSLQDDLKHLNTTGYALDRMFSFLAANIMIAVGAMGLAFKTFTDNFFRLDTQATRLMETLGYTQNEAFALSKALESINVSGGELANALTSFYKSYFTDFRKQMMMLRFGIDPSLIFRLDPLSFVRYVTETIKRAGYPLPLQRAILASVLGRELYDIVNLMQRYNVDELIRKYRTVFTPDAVQQMRRLIVDFGLIAADFWVFVYPFLRAFADVLADIVEKLRAVAEFFRGNSTLINIVTWILKPLMWIIMLLSGWRVLTLFGRLGQLILTLGRIAVNAGNILAAKNLLDFLVRLFKIIATIAIGGPGGAIGYGIGFVIKTLLKSVIVGGFAFLIERILSALGQYLGFGKGSSDKTAKAIEDNTQRTAYYTQLSYMALTDIRTELTRAIRWTMVGGTVPPLYQILSVQMRWSMALMHNTSAF